MIENEYLKRINTVIDYVEKRLEYDFTLAELAEVSNFSKFHFARIFRGVTGETPFELILRLRLEKAASFLMRSEKSISEIAFRCGFKSLPVFSKNFKSHFNESASTFRKNNSNLNKKNQKDVDYLYHHVEDDEKQSQNEFVEIRQYEEQSVIYLRHFGPYLNNAELFGGLFNRLSNWAVTKGITQNNKLRSFIVYHDDLDYSNNDKLRTSVCLSAPDNIKVDGDIGKMKIQGGLYVQARFNLKSDEIKPAWDWLMGSWFPKSGYEPDDKICFEEYYSVSSEGRFNLDVCVPVRSLR